MQIILLLLGAALNLCTVISAYVGSQKTLSNSNKSPESPFGVGFDLTASYGSAAVAFPNGTIVAVAHIPAEQDYNDVLQRLSWPASQHLSPPYNNVGESWDDMPRQYLRKARKAVGLPASQDVGHLAKMLSGLRTVVEERVGPIMTAAVTTMHLPALYDEDLHDAFEYVGLEYITFPVGDVGHNILYETSAAFAGYGYGLCSDYEADPEACKNEQWNMTDRAVMAVVYTDTALSVSLSVIRSAYALWEPPYRYLSDFDIGYQASLSSTAEYWATLGVKLGEILIENPNYERPSMVMLMGDRIEEYKFREVLNKVLSEQTQEWPEVLSKSGREVAAKGAAELAKREIFYATQNPSSCSKATKEEEEVPTKKVGNIREQEQM